jgi:hypothetical protein
MSATSNKYGRLGGKTGSRTLGLICLQGEPLACGAKRSSCMKGLPLLKIGASFQQIIKV